MKFHDIPDEEKQHQYDLLQGIFDRHARELTASGAAMRAIWSAQYTRTNESSVRDPLSVRTRLRVSRSTFANMKTWQKLQIQSDLPSHLYDPIDSVYANHFMDVVGDPESPSYALRVNRFEQVGDTSINRGFYVVGVQLAASARNLLNCTRSLVPLRSIKQQDVAMVYRQLSEIEKMKQDHDLSVINAVTLHEAEESPAFLEQ